MGGKKSFFLATKRKKRVLIINELDMAIQSYFNHL